MICGLEKIMNTLSGTIFRLMPARLSELQRVYDGLAITGNGDDPGLYLVVPRVAHWFHISVAHAYDLTIGFCVLACALVGSLAVKEWTAKRTAYFFSAVGLTCIAGDVYVFLALPALAGIPWLIRNEKHIFWIAALAGLCSIFRSGAALPYALLLILICWKRKPVLAAAVLVLAFVPQTWARHTYPQNHPFWHSVYIGLGWIHNTEVPKYQDEVGFAKGKQLAPSAVAYSDQYEAALESEVVRIATHEPGVLAENLALKATLILLMLGILLFPAFPRLPFMASIVTASLPGMIATPNPKYIIGALAIACMTTAFCTESESSRAVPIKFIARPASSK